MAGNSSPPWETLVLQRSLEQVWGIEWPPRLEALARIERPWGFIVAERRIRARDPQGLLVYLVRKEGVPTSTVVKGLSRLLAGRARPLGLKDSDAIAYQYILVESPLGDPPRRIEGKGYTAWFVGSRAKPPSIGAHLWNNFRLHLTLEWGDPQGFCREAREALVPGFYGPQRFGIARPNTHLYSLYALLREPGRLLAEYSYKYPLEWGSSHAYEDRIVGEAARLGDPFVALRRPPPSSVVRDALQSYIWNRALSIVLDRGGTPAVYEKQGRALCPGERKVYLARLPSRALLSSRGDWAGTVRRVVRLEGLPSYALPGKAPMRPLATEPCRVTCKPLDGDRIVLWLTLPRGLYATIAVRAVSWVHWLPLTPAQRG